MVNDKIKGNNQGLGYLIGENGEKQYLELSKEGQKELDKLKEELDLSGISDTIVSSIHPITVMGIETFKQEFYKLGEFEDFVYDWIRKEKEDMIKRFEKLFEKEEVIHTVAFEKFKKNELGRRR